MTSELRIFKKYLQETPMLITEIYREMIEKGLTKRSLSTFYRYSVGIMRPAEYRKRFIDNSKRNLRK